MPNYSIWAGSSAASSAGSMAGASVYFGCAHPTPGVIITMGWQVINKSNFLEKRTIAPIPWVRCIPLYRIAEGLQQLRCRIERCMDPEDTSSPSHLRIRFQGTTLLPAQFRSHLQAAFVPSNPPRLQVPQDQGKQRTRSRFHNVWATAAQKENYEQV